MSEEENETDDGEVIAGRNGFDKDEVQSFVDRVENVDAKIDEIMEKAKKDCQPHRDDIKEIKNDASDEGLAKKPFNALLRRRKLLRKAEAVEDALNEQQKDDFIHMAHALGDLADTPLGQAAMS